MEAKKYKVTIAVPVYGVESYVEKCAVSLFEQTYPNLEYLFVNDCTPDRSATIIQRTLERYPHRKEQVRIINQSENKGCPAARNLAIQIATGEFVLFVDGDDYLEKDSVSSLVSEQEATAADLVVGNSLNETKEGKVMSRYLDINQTRENIVIDCLADKSCQGICGLLIRRSLFLKYNIKANESFHVGEDWQVTPLLLFYANKISYIDKIIYHYRVANPGSVTNSSQSSYSKLKERSICFVKTMNSLLESFKDKGDVYSDVIFRKKAVFVQDALIYSCLDRDKSSFQDMLSELKSINQVYLSVLGNNNIFIKALKRNYYTLSFLLYIKKTLV